MDAASYKNARRAELAREFDIWVNFGDQDSDMAGENNGIKVKLPNPQYKIS